MKAIFGAIFNFLAHPAKRSILLIAILAIVAAIDFFSLGFARRTFVFYNADTGVVYVEDRMLKHSRSKEEDIIRYTEEALLGPVNPDLLPLFPWGTRLKTLMYRDKIVYADLTQSAALPPAEGGNLLVNFQTLYDSILRNFPYVNDVIFFVEGNVVSFEPRNELNEEKGGFDVTIGKRSYSIRYATGADGVVYVPKDKDFTLSCDNRGGYIITAWEQTG